MSYQELAQHFRRLAHFEELAAIVNWDQAVNMPAAAGASRARALSSMARLMHDIVVDPRVSDWVAEAQQEAGLDPWQKANVREIARQVRRATCLPADLVEASTEACNVSEQAWRKLRGENDFASFRPYLEKVVQLQRETAAALADALQLSPYDALMDAYEPGMKSADVDRAFAPVREFLPSFIEEVLERQSKVEVLRPTGPFAIDAQRVLARRLMEASGLDMGRARLDESHHPFCGGVPQDVRITNRYRSDEFLSGLMGVLHEAGHGKYEQGLPGAYLDQPVGKARGMVVHESQSLLQEMQVSRGEDFMHFLAAQISDVFAEQARKQPAAFALVNLSRLQTQVERGFIRVDADEVTYPAHVMVRYDLERALIDGSLQVADLPEAWDEKMRHYLGVSTLGNDKDGCMQDVHWPSGAFGYFPLYTLGAMTAAQLFSTARAQLTELGAQLRKGDLSQLDGWLREKVWSRGSRDSIDTLLSDATGEVLHPRFFIEHLRARYGAGSAIWG